MRLLDAVLRKAERAAMLGAAAALFTMMTVTLVDVVMRYVLNSPLGWSQEVITHYLLPASFFLALAHTLRADGHIKITLVDRFASARSRWLMSTVGHALAAGLFALLLWHGAGSTFDAWQAGLTYPGYILWPTWLSEVLVPVGIGLLELRILQRLGMLLADRRRSRYTVVDAVERSAAPTPETLPQ